MVIQFISTLCLESLKKEIDMWQVSNNLNTPVLNRYGNLISSLFELIINISQRADKENLLLNDDFLSNEFRNTAYLDERLLNVNKTAQDRIIA